MGAAAASAVTLTGCGSRVSPFVEGGSTSRFSDRPPADRTLARADHASVYGAMDGERFPVAAFDYGQLDPTFLRQEVAFAGGEAPGTIIVDPNARFLTG